MLSGKFAVVTGGSEGIGFGIAKAFVENDASVVLVGRNKAKLKQAQALLCNHSGDVQIANCDLSNINELKNLSAEFSEKYPKIDILVNNAGLAKFTEFAACTDEEFDAQMHLNIRAPFYLTKAMLPALEKAQGNVINISSYFANRMLANRPSSIYSCSKGALDSLTKALAFELGAIGVRVNAIAPGTVETPMMLRNIQQLDEKAKERFYNNMDQLYPLRRLGQPKDVANTAVFLASDQAQWITGLIASVDGGLTTH